MELQIVNDWKQQVFGQFYFNIIRVELSIGGVALFYFSVEPTGYSNEFSIAFSILGIGILVDRIKLPRR